MISEQKYTNNKATSAAAAAAAAAVVAAAATAANNLNKYQQIKPILNQGYESYTNTSSNSINNKNSNLMGNNSLNSSSKMINSCSSNTGSVNVKFSGFFKDKIDEREKYLTAKYPNHQMALIKKRLKVEFWIDEQLKYLFNINVIE